MFNPFIQQPKLALPPSFGGFLMLSGLYHVEQIRDDKVINIFDFKNDIVTEGKNKLLDVAFRNQTQIAAWYFGLVNNSGWTAFVAGDTAASHSGWTELTAYDESTRVAWSPGAASSGSVTNGTVATFTINASGNVKGIFVASVSTKSSTSGTLWSTAAFGSVVPVSSGDQLKVTYTVNS